MWSRLILARNLKSVNLSSLQPASKESFPKNAKLTHRFVEYLQSINTGDQQNSIKPINKAGGTRALLQLDKILCNKASDLSSNEILQYLTICMLQSPRKVTDLQFYSISKSMLAHRMMTDTLTPQQLVHFMYMLALNKKSYDVSKYMKKCLLLLEKDDIYKSLTLMDLLIVCNATFKTSTRMYNTNVLKTLEECLYNNLNLLDDPGMFVTLVKSFRHNECQSEELLTTISAVIFFNRTYKYYTFTAISHILPLYADYLYYDEQLFNLLAQCAVDHLKQSVIQQKNSYFVDNIRCKDIKRFLWCCYFVAHSLEKKDLSVILEKIHDRLLGGHYDDEPDTLFDSLFYLWMMEFSSEKLLDACKNKIHIIRGMQNKSKIRVNILLVCMQIEKSQLYKQFGHKADVFKPDKNKEFERRPHLMKIYNALKSFVSDLSVNRLEFEYQVPHINIMGITGYRKNVYKAFVVDVLDNTNSIMNVSGHPSGPMKLKLRLLYKMDITVVLLNLKDIEDLNELDLKEYIRKEMSIVS